MVREVRVPPSLLVPSPSVIYILLVLVLYYFIESLVKPPPLVLNLTLDKQEKPRDRVHLI